MTLTSTAADSNEEQAYAIHPRIAQRMEQFRRIPRLVMDLEFFLRFAGLVMFHNLLDCTCALPRILMSPLSARKRDVLAVYFVTIGLVAFYFAGYPDNTVLYETLYHTVRTTATIKLYLLFSILEVSDRLLTCVTSDSIEICFATLQAAHRRHPASPSRMLVIGAFAVATVSVALHSMVLLLHVVTLNVAINSEGNSLIPLLISNNFVEVKSVVFKKYNRETLLQVCCADALERVQLALFVCCMLLQHLRMEGFGSIQSEDVVVVIVCELLVDFLKHYFVATFNGVGLSLYRSFYHVLMFDVAADHMWGKTSATIPIVCDDAAMNDADLRQLISPATTFAPHASRRCGFVPMPYVALLLWSISPVLVELVHSQHYGVVALGLLATWAVQKCIHRYLAGHASRFVVRSLLSMDASRSAPLRSGEPCTLFAPPVMRHMSLSATTAHTMMGVSPQLTPLRTTKVNRREVELPRSKSLPLLRPQANSRRSQVHLSKVLVSLLRTERFDVNAGKSSASFGDSSL